MLASGLDHVIDAFEAGWNSVGTRREIHAFNAQIALEPLAEFWRDGRYFAQREIDAVTVAERKSSLAKGTNVALGSRRL